MTDTNPLREALEWLETELKEHGYPDSGPMRSRLRATLAAAPQPAPAEREALMDLIGEALTETYVRWDIGDPAEHITDALLAQRGGAEAGLREAAQFLCDRLDDFEITEGGADGMIRDYMGHVAPAHERLKAVLSKASKNRARA